MDLFTISLILTMSALSLVVGFVLGRFRRRSVENSGEAQARKALAKYCQSHDAHVLSNVTLSLEDSTTTQVDHVLVSTRGGLLLKPSITRAGSSETLNLKFGRKPFIKKRISFRILYFKTISTLKPLRSY